jgi:hypothetical protein
MHTATDDDTVDDGSSDTARDVQDWRRRLCENALDVVQTRSCRVVLKKNKDDAVQWDQINGMKHSRIPLRLLAPVFDLINHGGPTGANAEFRLETTDTEAGTKEERLVVRATRDLNANEQILIDYGGAARPAWKCLASYGFVPPFEQSKDDNNGDNDDPYDNEEEHVAEVFIGGVRYEVGPTTIPQDMVANANANANASIDNETQAADDNVDTLTPDVAIGLARRMSNLAYQLLHYGVAETQEPSKQDDDDSSNNESSLLSPEEIVSSKLALSLRLNQHNILMACSMGLRDWAGGGKSSS